jgi:hypothetical protein
MATRRRIVVGSLAGAVAIHLVMLACSANAPSIMGPADGGGLDAAGSDVAIADVARLDTGSTTTDTGAATPDTGQHDAGFLDTLLDAVRDVIGEVVDAEVRDAHAGGDGGVADAGPTGCACPPPPVPATYTFSGRAAGLPIFGPSSEAHVNVRALPPGLGVFGMPEPVWQITFGFTAWISRTRGPVAPNTYVTVSCSNLRADATGRVVGSAQIGCRIHDNNSHTTTSDNGATVTVTLTTLSAREVEVRVASLAFPEGSSGIPGPIFTDLVFRATDPSGHFLTPSNAYVP